MFNQLLSQPLSGTVAVAAMRCGFPIFRVEDSMHMLGGYCQGAEEGSHGSLGYGISWQLLSRS